MTNFLRPLTIILALSLCLSPLSVFGQAEGEVVPADAPVTEVDPTPEGAEQVTIDSSLLETTVNPQADTLTPQVPDAPPTDDATTTPIDIPPDADPVSMPAPVIAPDIALVIEVDVLEVTPMDVVELQPKKEYTFALQGNTIPAKATTDWTKSQTEKEKSRPVKQVSNAVALDVQSNGVLEVSGACTDPYYVVLLYKSADDYDKSPASYIFNKAFDCVGGRYSYAISDLPKDLASGTYYLLVGGQGAKGGWKPISSLAPIAITNQKDAQ
ncbi:MAG: hypothetical protein JWN89_261 [Parcubacteria group bacterium]|nr:hypothetical protein [Parcubacteria group bacterium]